ncbi:hypothetical protein [Thalassovita aquimarina]|nr:hypothetical protein [Thalassovita aquimarina]
MALFYFCASQAVGANAVVAPAKPETMKASCQFIEYCLAGETFSSGENCRSENTALYFNTDGETGIATITHPNGTKTLGTALQYDRYGNASYVVVATGDGAGTSMITLMPNMDAIWTGHFTLSRNIASTHFGFYEVTS